MVVTTTAAVGSSGHGETEEPRCSEDLDSTCSTPYVSAPSSPGRTGYFFSAPASPMHFVLYSAPPSSARRPPPEHDAASSSPMEFEFDFSSRFSTGDSRGSMSSADELFVNGQIRPMKLSSHLQRPQMLAPLLDLEEEDDEAGVGGGGETKRGRDLKLRSRSVHRKARSLSPLRNAAFQWHEEEEEEEERAGEREVSECIRKLQEDYSEEKKRETEVPSVETTPSCSTSSSRSSSSGRNSKKWIFLKDLLHRSKSEGRGNGKEKFWSSISFSPSKEKKLRSPSKEEKRLPGSEDNDNDNATKTQQQKQKQIPAPKKTVATGKPTNGVAKRRVPPSAHELHYTANRAQAEEMKKRTYLPYRHGLFGCLGFSSKGYSALNGLARSLNPVSSR